MKKSLILSTVSLIFAFVAVVCSLVSLTNSLRRYERPATVTEVWEADVDEVVCVDKQGQIWEFRENGFEVGQEIVLIMDDMETVGIRDDRIIKVKK